MLRADHTSRVYSGLAVSYNDILPIRAGDSVKVAEGLTGEYGWSEYSK